MKQTVNDLCRIAQNGAGFKLDAKSFTVNDLCRIAGNMTANVKLVITSADAVSVNDLCRIAQNGSGSVFFEN